jgi:hypothetical protein
MYVLKLKNFMISVYCTAIFALCGNMAATCNSAEKIEILSLIILYWILLGNVSLFLLFCVSVKLGLFH